MPYDLGRSKKALLLLMVMMTLVAMAGCHWLSVLATKALLPPLPPDQNLEHFRRNRSLAHYLDNIQLLIEPSSHACITLDPLPVIVLVATSPGRFDHRQAIRRTWARHLPAYFVLGLNGVNVDEQLVDVYLEAKQNSDMIVYEFRDHYQNLTLKTALMMQWTLTRCAGAQFLYKVDDDVFVNPWRFDQVLREHEDSKLLGYRKDNCRVHRDEYTKWYMPRWLFPQDRIPEYLAGPGYLIKTAYLQEIFTKAQETPLVNLEDVYFTHIVAGSLKLNLTHDKRLSPHKPWLFLACGYWNLASAHGLTPDEMVEAWEKVAEIVRRNTNYIDIWIFLLPRCMAFAGVVLYCKLIRFYSHLFILFFIVNIVLHCIQIVSGRTKTLIEYHSEIICEP